MSVIQFTPVFGKTEENLARIGALTESLQTDIVVLPELCTTGYFFLSRDEVAQVAESVEGATVKFFRDLAVRLSAVVVAGFAESNGNKLYNACLITVPEKQQVWVYRKIHLFYKEQHCFDVGDSGFFIVDDDRRDIRIGPMVCYDWRFPESARILTLLGADLIVCPANLITEAWKMVMPARAIENKVYLAVANRAGMEKRENEELHFKGCSAVYDFNGRELQRAERGDDEILNVAIDPVKTRDKSFNQINDVLKDRQPQHYHQLVN